MIGQTIKRLRLEHGLTQKELADQLFVTSQAVSRWEKGDVEPSLRSIAEMAKIFGVTTDEILGIDSHANESEPSDEADAYATHEQMLALCEICNQPIFKSEDIVRIRRGNVKEIRCRECQNRISEAAERRAAQELKQQEEKSIKKAKWARVKSGVLGAIFLLWYVWSFISSLDGLNASTAGVFAVGAIGLLVMFYIVFSFASCCFFRNSFFGTMLLTTATFLEDNIMDCEIFDDGILFLLSLPLRLALYVIGGIAALIAGICVAPFLYPFALHKNLKHPEKTRIKGFWVVKD